ncbi:MAG: winged helix-turn-helix domain-containing protein [Candidatus Odinarchaeota archaeon]
MTLPGNTSSGSSVSTDTDRFIRHVLISWIMALLFGMETNAKVKLDRTSLFNNMLILMGGALEQQGVDGTVTILLVQRYLDKLIEKGFVEEEESNYSLTELGRVLGKIKYRAVKEKLQAATVD